MDTPALKIAVLDSFWDTLIDKMFTDPESVEIVNNEDGTFTVIANAGVTPVDYRKTHLDVPDLYILFETRLVWQNSYDDAFTAPCGLPVDGKSYIGGLDELRAGYPDHYKIQLYDFLHTHCAADKIWNILGPINVTFHRVGDAEYESHLEFKCEAITITNKMSERRVLYDKFNFSK